MKHLSNLKRLIKWVCVSNGEWKHSEKTKSVFTFRWLVLLPEKQNTHVLEYKDNSDGKWTSIVRESLKLIT